MGNMQSRRGGGCSIEMVRDCPHSMALSVRILDEPTDRKRRSSHTSDQSPCPRVCPSIQPSLLHSASRATYHAFGAKAVCLSSFVARSHGPREHENVRGGGERTEGRARRVA